MAISNNRTIVGWFTSGFLTIFVPLIIFWTARARFAYQYNQNNNDNNNQDNNNEQDEFTTPWWFWGGSGDRERREEDGSPALIATYLWSVLVFSGLLFYGYQHMNRTESLQGLVAVLVLFANYNFVSLLILGGVEGAVETEGRAVEEHGFVGQFGVLVYLTNIGWIVFGIGYGLFFLRKYRLGSVTKIEVDAADYRIHETPTTNGQSA